MTIISSTSLGVCWFDLSLLICQSMLISLTYRNIKCRGSCTSTIGKREKKMRTQGEGKGTMANGHFRGHSSLVAPKGSELARASEASHCFYSKPRK